MGLKLANNAISRLAAGIAAVDLSLSVTPGDGSLFPSLSAGDFFPATLVRASDGAVEIIKVTARSTDVLTIERAQEGTTALVFLVSDRIELRLTSATVLDLPASATHAATAKATPVDADEFGYWDSVSGLLRKASWANIKATLKTYFDTLYAALAGATFTGPVLFKTAAAIASATSIDLTGLGSGFIATVTGVTPTTTFVMSDGQFGTLVAEGAWPLTYHATTNKLVGGADVTAYAGQYFRVSKTGGVVSCEPIAPKAVKGNLRNATGTTLTNATTWYKVTLDAEVVSGLLNDAANSRLVCSEDGAFCINWNSYFILSGTANVRVLCRLYLNGALAHGAADVVLKQDISNASTPTSGASTILDLSAGDTLELYANSNVAGAVLSANYTQLSAFKIGA